MTDKITDKRLAEIREGLAEFDKRRLETSMSGGVDTPGRVTYHFGPSTDGLPRYGISGMLPEIATELMAEVERLRVVESGHRLRSALMDLTIQPLLEEIDRVRARNAYLSMRLDEVTHELEEHVVPERDSLREEVASLTRETKNHD